MCLICEQWRQCHVRSFVTLLESEDQIFERGYTCRSDKLQGDGQICAKKQAQPSYHSNMPELVSLLINLPIISISSMNSW